MKDATTLPARSPLDSERFGVSIARLSVGDEKTLASGITFCRRRRVDMLIARCRTADIGVAQAMEREGFRLMDTLIWLRRPLPLPSVPPDDEITARACRDDDLAEAKKTARRAFQGYAGHYSADPRLPRRTVDEVYPSWLENSWPTPEDGGARNVFVALLEGSIVGFLTVARLTATRGELPIGGTAPEIHARGLTRRVTDQLAAACMAWLHEQGASEVITSVHAFNTPMQRILGRMGFEPYDSEYTFHKWFRP